MRYPWIGSVAGLLLVACAEDRSTVTVYEAGPVVAQCEPAATTLEQSAGRLDQAGIEILRSSCGVISDMGFAAVCGGATGQILLHDIRGSSLAAAQSLGFKDAATLVADAPSGDGWERAPCP